MRFKFTVLLLALNLLAFGLIFYLGTRDGQDPAKPGGLAASIGREIVEADRIELHGKDIGEPRVLRRKGSDWTITAPLQWSANYFAINRILNQLQFLEEETSFPVDEIRQGGQTLADYGLDDPALRLVVAEGDESIELAIGTFTDVGNNVYVLGPRKERIFVVSREVINSLLVELSDLRTREIFSIPVFEVEALGLQIRSPENGDNGELKVRLARTNDGWIFESPLTAEADPTLVANTITNLTASKVIEFKTENNDTATRGLETPFMRVTLFGNKRRQTLLLGNLDPAATRNPAYFAKLEDNPTVFTVDAAPFDELVKAQEALRERNFMKFDPAALTAINISEDEREIRLQKLESEEGAWQVIESGGDDDDIRPHRADADVMRNLIEELEDLRASAFVIDAPTEADLKRLGFDDPRRTVRLSLANADPVTLLLAHPDDEIERLYAKNNQAAFIYAVERRPTLDLFPLNEFHYRNRVLENLPRSARIQSLRIERIGGEEALVDLAPSKDEDWDAHLAERPETEAAAVRSILDSIRTMNVKSYLKDEYSDAYQIDPDRSLPWTYRITAEVLLPGDETDRIETREYVLTDRLSGTVQVAGSERHDAIFQISQDLIDALRALTDSMDLPPEATGDPVPDPEDVEPVPEPAPTDGDDDAGDADGNDDADGGGPEPSETPE